MSSPTVSVILPTYNDVLYLPEAVDSIRNQSFTDWELIILDDGSTDATAEYLESIQPRDRIRVFRCEHTGSLGYLRNKGIDESQGDIITFQDSDDVWYGEKLEAQVGAMSRNPSYGWSYHRVKRVDQHGNPLPDIRTSAAKPVSGSILAEVADLRIPIAVPAVAIRKDVLRNIGGFREELRYTQQYELWFRLAESSPGLGIDEALCAIRTREDSHTQDSRTENFRYWMIIYHELMQRSTGEIRNIASQQMVRYGGLYARRHAREGSMRNAIRAQRERLAYHRMTLDWWMDWLRIFRQPRLRQTTARLTH
jgi:glycosyltransferase involved in cell wall biosynthesis